MFREAQELLGYAIAATDGLVGEVVDIYFDDHEWTMRYLVVETGAWLKHRKVLISPHSLGCPDSGRRQLPASITIAQVRSSPDIDTTKPVSRQHEALFLSHYQHPHYWEGAGAPAVSANPDMQSRDSQFDWSDEHFSKAIAARRQEPPRSALQAEQHLRSCNAIAKYSVRSREADIGHIHGILFMEEDWIIRYLVVQRGHWWLGQQMLVAVRWIEEMDWLGASLSVDISRRTLIDAPTYDPSEPLGRIQEIELFKHFGRAGYWHSEPSDRGN